MTNIQNIQIFNPFFFLFLLLTGSTTQWEMHPEVMEAGLNIHNDIMRRRIQEYNGYEGFLFCFVFSISFIFLFFLFFCSLFLLYFFFLFLFLSLSSLFLFLSFSLSLFLSSTNPNRTHSKNRRRRIYGVIWDAMGGSTMGIVNSS